jgi:GGDEF domain-containing protein
MESRMRTPNPQSEAALPLRVGAVVAVWAPCAVLLGLALGSPLAVAVLTLAILAVTYVQARFDAWSMADAAWSHAGSAEADDTGLAAPSQADHFLASEFAAARRGRKVTLVMFGLDGVVHGSNGSGRQDGADVLRAFGCLLSGMTRRMNLTARYGWRSNVFLSVLSGADAEAAAGFVERVREAAAADGGIPDFTAGIVEYTPDIADPAHFVEKARGAMQHARSGRESVVAQSHDEALQAGTKGWVNAGS